MEHTYISRFHSTTTNTIWVGMCGITPREQLSMFKDLVQRGVISVYGLYIVASPVSASLCGTLIMWQNGSIDFFEPGHQSNVNVTSWPPKVR